MIKFIKENLLKCIVIGVFLLIILGGIYATTVTSIEITEAKVKITHLDMVVLNGNIKYFCVFIGDVTDVTEITVEEYARYNVNDNLIVTVVEKKTAMKTYRIIKTNELINDSTKQTFCVRHTDL